jgi:purine-nucleoside phosphorylase
MSTPIARRRRAKQTLSTSQGAARGPQSSEPLGWYERATAAADAIRSRCGEPPRLAIVLGSGLGDFAETLGDAVHIPYTDIPHWPASTVVGHAGKLVVGSVKGRRVAALSGRVHVYEGHGQDTVVFGVRVMARLGVAHLILTNAAGGINTSFGEGALMVIDDHINLTGGNPLIGANDDRFGPRFPDMCEIYSRRLRDITEQAAEAMGVPVARGVYLAVHGPSYETPAEILAFRALGADAVGMSTAPEAIAARHAGLEVLGISCITNMAAGVLPQPLKHDEVMETARRVRGAFIALLEAVIARV